MPMVRVEITGVRGLIMDLNNLSDKGKSVLSDGANAGAEYLLPKVRDKIKPGNEDDTHLRDTLKVVKARRKRATKQSALVQVGQRSAEYAMHLETGHRTKDGKHVQESPFARPAADENAEEVSRVVVQTILDKMGV